MSLILWQLQFTLCYIRLKAGTVIELAIGSLVDSDAMILFLRLGESKKYLKP